MFAVLEHIDRISPTVQSFWFRSEKPLTFTAGQFTELYLPHAADNRGEKRWFTISSAPHERLFSITVKFAQQRSSSFKQTLLQIPLGTRLYFADPMGDFVLPKDAHIPLLFVAGGIGITPMHSMIAFLQANKEQRRITLLHQVPNAQELLFGELFQQQPRLHYVPIISRLEHMKNSHMLEGKVNISLILSELQQLPEALIYISGPEPLVEYLAHTLPQHSVPNYRIVTDFFHGYTDV